MSHHNRDIETECSSQFFSGVRGNCVPGESTKIPNSHRKVAEMILLFLI